LSAAQMRFILWAWVLSRASALLAARCQRHAYPSRRSRLTCCDELVGLEALKVCANRVRAAAAAFGPFHEYAASDWLDRSLVGGGSCTDGLRSRLHEHDLLMAECVLSDDGTVDPRCAEIYAALEKLQSRLDECHLDDDVGVEVGITPPTDAREWVECVLLSHPNSSAQLSREKTLVLWGEKCKLSECEEPSECEELQQALADYFELVQAVT